VHIEQKSWTHVSKLLDWDRYESRAAVEAINRSGGKNCSHG